MMECDEQNIEMAQFIADNKNATVKELMNKAGEIAKIS